jgi:hypothetical protein
MSDPTPTDTLTAAIIAASQDGNMAPIHDTLRSVHSSQRGPVQSAALIAAMAADDYNMAATADILSAFANVPTASRQRAAIRRELTTTEAAAIRAHAVRVWHFGIDDVTDDVVAALLPEFADVVSAAIDRVAAAIDGVPIGRPVRMRSAVSMADLLTAGTLSDGDTLTGPTDDIVATLSGDGTVDVNGTTYGTVSAAATAVTGSQTNGWQFWRLSGVTLADLRSGTNVGR